jgi:hypothetical protein
MDAGSYRREGDDGVFLTVFLFVLSWKWISSSLRSNKASGHKVRQPPTTTKTRASYSLNRWFR